MTTVDQQTVEGALERARPEAATETRTERALAYSAMHERFSGPVRRILSWLFGPIHYPAQRAEQLRELAKVGVVVYVARAPSIWLALYFNHAITRLGLPLPKFVGGINVLLWQPVDRLWRLWKSRKLKIAGAWSKRFAGAAPTRGEAVLAQLTLHGGEAFIFLKPQRTLTRASRPDRNDYFRALIAVQKISERPIFLVPHTVASKGQAGSARRTLTDRLFGDRRQPGRLRRMVMMIAQARQAAVRVSDPINLKDFLAEHGADDDQLAARRLRHETHRRISEEERVVAGPDLSAYHHTIARHVLRTPALREIIEAEAKRSGKPVEQLEKLAQAHLDHIAARYNVHYVWVLDRILQWVFNRIYDGMVVDERGLLTALEAARRGPLIYCPTHRSHVDYLVMSYVLWHHGITPPHIAAGANLSFFPLGHLFRRCGAFFLRRTFRDDPLYAAVFRSYVGELLRAGTSLEFFPEGTRSRTGKMLLPKFGMFSMIVDAWRQGARDDAIFVPVSIDYERIIEARSYEHELLGGEKQAENVKGLFKTTSVLRSRYGRVHLQFGPPISLADLARERGLSRESSEEQWRVEIERLGYRTLHEAAMVVSITPTTVVCTALLCHHGRGIAQDLLLTRCTDIIEFLDMGAARLSASLQEPGNRPAAMLEAIQNLVDEGMVAVDRAGRSDVEPIYRVPEERRIRLDYYKNGIMNHMAPSAIVSRSLQRRRDGQVSYQNLREDTRFLSRLFKREFLYRADSDFDTYFDDALAGLAVRGYLDVHDDGAIVVHAPEPVSLLAATLDSFVQAYWIAAQALTDLRQFPLWDKELSNRAMERARRAFLEGRISRAEAASRPTIEAAIAWFVSQGILTTTSEGRRKTVRLSPDYEGAELDALIADIGAYL